MEEYQHNHLHHARANKTYRHGCPPQPQAYRMDRRVHFANAHTTKTWPLLGNGRIMGGAINQPRFALTKQQLVDTVLLSAKPSSRGTGVFLPRTEAYNHMTGRDKTPRITHRTPHHTPHYIRQQGQQKEQQQLHMHAHALVIAHEKQERKMKEANATSHDCSNELDLPHEWIY
ncbi:hypothetical protein HU200_023439 [Digitaria exilis]|uniref:Uncharacterized protein n=1 Tax=Digitaria exilis TaxID=1010633 RepID=A0A835C333_9POAL|nr:hypothetical protein HU200_023439 [Digitaria exilis]